MAKSLLRKINVDGSIYLWKTGHYHLKEFKHSECAERVTVYLKDYKNSPIHIHFRLEDNSYLQEDLAKSNWFIDWGCLQNKNKVVNLNRPGVIKILIRYFISKEWNPETSKTPYHYYSGLKLLSELDFPEGIN